MYKKASRLKLRFKTNNGVLSTENLWDLKLDTLDSLAVSLKSDYDESDKKSFLSKKTEKDIITKLKFDIVLDILNTKVEEENVKTKSLETKRHNEQIMELIKKKEESELEGKSIDELKKLLK